jgi:pyruvate dehydrogenase phosphatase
LPLGVKRKQHKKYIDILSSVEDPGKLPMNAQYDSMFHLYQTPPYLNATPEVGALQIPDDGFIIIATDGLWSDISSKDAADVVTRGINKGADDLARYLLEARSDIKPPGDDVTILVLRVMKS